MPTNRSKSLAPFDVVAVPFPYSDRLAEKRRPAVVISASEMTTKLGVVWLAMVTSADNRRWEGDIQVSDLAMAGLPAPSLIRPAKIATVDAARIVKRIGKLPTKDAQAIGAQIQKFLG